MQTKQHNEFKALCDFYDGYTSEQLSRYYFLKKEVLSVINTGIELTKEKQKKSDGLNKKLML